jgi:hypothetical protein
VKKILKILMNIGKFIITIAVMAALLLAVVYVDEIIEFFKTGSFEPCWKIASASYYDPMDARQTKSNPDGIGASGHRIQSGSIGMDSTFVKDFTNNYRKVVFIGVSDPNLDVMTPYGKNIFRVDDTMSGKMKDSIYIDFFYGDLTYYHRRVGRFNVRFRIVRIE